MGYVRGNLADKTFRALASSGALRSEATPEVATLRGSGVGGYDVISGNALFAPAGAPPEIEGAGIQKQ